MARLDGRGTTRQLAALEPGLLVPTHGHRSALDLGDVSAVLGIQGRTVRASGKALRRRPYGLSRGAAAVTAPVPIA